MSTPLQDLPTFRDETLSALSPSELLSLLIEHEDRVPRNVIDECARRGEDMAQTLGALVEDDRCWSEEAAPGEWWALLHAAMILGLIPGERSGLLLAQLMRRMAEEDESLEEWLAGKWPALFHNKPDSVFPALRAVCEDRGLDWYARANALEPVVASAQGRGAETLNSALAWVAGLAADESEDWDLRLWAGNLLVDFPRPEYRPFLDDLAKRQEGKRLEQVFSAENVRDAFTEPADRPQWERFANPWRDFYAPVAIERRQEQWAEGEAESDLEYAEDDVPEEPMIPYVRATAKVGRNDPCPCGSGKKYKRCCLPNEQA